MKAPSRGRPKVTRVARKDLPAHGVRPDKCDTPVRDDPRPGPAHKRSVQDLTAALANQDQGGRFDRLKKDKIASMRDPLCPPKFGSAPVGRRCEPRPGSPMWLSGLMVNDQRAGADSLPTTSNWGSQMMGSSTTLVGRSILVVEDEAVIALGLKELFEDEGANVYIASSPNDAMSLVDDLVISAAVVDFGSSADDNGRLCRTLRAYGIPFMYYTGYDDVEEGRWGAPVITKPAGAQVLIATLAQLLVAPPANPSRTRNPTTKMRLEQRRRSKANGHRPHC